MSGFRAAFPDINITIEDVIAEGGKVAFRSTMHGTHLSECLGVSPTGRDVIFSLLDVIRIDIDQIVEQWGGPDVYDLLQQLGGE